jgi:predicted DNA-binding transcriptional regulator AlpA
MDNAMQNGPIAMKSLQSLPTAGRKQHKPPKSSKPRSKSPPIERTGEFLSKREISAKLGISPRTLEAWVEEEKFPAPYCLTGQTLRWEAKAIERFLEEAKTRWAAKN